MGNRFQQQGSGLETRCAGLGWKEKYNKSLKSSERQQWKKSMINTSMKSNSLTPVACEYSDHCVVSQTLGRREPWWKYLPVVIQSRCKRRWSVPPVERFGHRKNVRPCASCADEIRDRGWVWLRLDCRIAGVLLSQWLPVRGGDASARFRPSYPQPLRWIQLKW